MSDKVRLYSNDREVIFFFFFFKSYANPIDNRCTNSKQYENASTSALLAFVKLYFTIVFEDGEAVQVDYIRI